MKKRRGAEERHAGPRSNGKKGRNLLVRGRGEDEKNECLKVGVAEVGENVTEKQGLEKKRNSHQARPEGKETKVGRAGQIGAGQRHDRNEG